MSRSCGKLLQMMSIFVWGICDISATGDYCNPNLCGPNVHIACGHSGNFSPNCSADAALIEMTPPLSQQILDKHNELRNRVAGGLEHLPPANRMATMQWHRELAHLAELNVRQCQMRHDQCRNTKEFPFSGQNLASRQWMGFTLTASEIAMANLNAWFNEYNNTERHQIESYTSSGNVVGHFTAMVQDRSTRVGCAIVQQTLTNGFTQSLMACNYAYTNMLNAPVYASGTAASQCTSGVNPNYPFLCSVNEIY